MGTVFEGVFPNGPLSIPREHLMPFTLAIGGLIIAWGSAEASLNLSLMTVFKHTGGHHHSKEIPVALGRKLKFMRRCFRRISVLEPYSADGLALLGRVSDMATHRNNVVHGFLTNWQVATGYFTFTNFGSVGTEPSVRGQAKYTAGDLMQIGNACMVLAPDLADFADRLMQDFVIKKPKEDGRSGFIGS